MLFVKEVIKNIGIENVIDGQEIDYLELDWDELSKRILRKETKGGREVAISLNEGDHLRVGDLLYNNNGMKIVVCSKKEDAYAVYPKTYQEMGKVAFELGNRHTPCLIKEKEIIIRYDQTLGRIFNEVGVDYEKTQRRFNEPFKHHSHNH